MTVLGVTIGEVSLPRYMLIQGRITHRSTRQCTRCDRGVRPARRSRKRCSVCPIPITISSAVMSLTDLIDVALISTRLQSPAVGMTAGRGNADLRHLHRSVINFFNLPQTLITALAVSVLPTIASARAAGNETGANRRSRPRCA